MDAIFRGRTGVLRPLTRCSPRSSASGFDGQLFPRDVADDDLAVGGELLQSLAQVYRVSDHRVFEPFLGTEQGRGDVPARHADPQRERLQTLGGPFGIDRRLCCVHRRGGHERAVGMIAGRLRRPEHRHHCVADVLHHGATRGEDRAVHLGAVTIELLGQQRRVGVLADGRVAADVAHQHGDVQLLAVARVSTAGTDALGNAGGKQPRQRLALFLARHDRVVDPLEPIERTGGPGRYTRREAQEQTLDSRLDGRRRRVASPRRSP